MARSLSAALRPLLLGILGVGLSAAAAAVSLDVGDIVVVEPGSDRLVKVDPVTGSQTLIASGSPMLDPFDVAFAPDGKLLIADPTAAAVIRVDPATGSQTVVSSGGFFVLPQRLAIDATGLIIVADLAHEDGALIAVDPSTGGQTLIASVQGGSGLSEVTAVAVEYDGQLVVVEADVPAVSRVDPSTGIASPLASGFPFLTDSAVVMDIGVETGAGASNGDVIVAWSGPASPPPPDTAILIRVDSSTGNQAIQPITSSSSGAIFNAFDRAPGGDFVLTIPLTGVFQVDAVTGTRTHLSSFTNAQGIAVRHAQCDDHLDNDGDGDVDGDDGDCANAADDNEGPPICGNASVDSGEQCDDGNTDPGDCCSLSCQFETGPGTPPCCDLGICQVGSSCGIVCFTPGSCQQSGGPGTPCSCAP